MLKSTVSFAAVHITQVSLFPFIITIQNLAYIGFSL